MSIWRRLFGPASDLRGLQITQEPTRVDRVVPSPTSKPLISEPSATTLLAQLSEHVRAKDGEKVCVILSELGKKRTAEAVPHIIPLISQSDGWGYIGEVPPMPSWLNGQFPYVHQRAAIALAQIGTKEAVDTLAEWAKKPMDGSGLSNVILKHLGLGLNPYRVYSTLSEALDAMSKVMLDMEVITDSAVRNDSRFSDFSTDTAYWHVFEGNFADSAAHLSHHFETDHMGSPWSFEVKNYARGLRVLTAHTKDCGHNHFVWRTATDLFVLLVSDDKSIV